MESVPYEEYFPYLEYFRLVTWLCVENRSGYLNITAALYMACYVAMNI